MNRRIAAVLLLVGCSSFDGGEPYAQVLLPLTAASTEGNVYRLRNASFRVSVLLGPEVRTVSTDDTIEPAPKSLDLSVDPGSYTVELLDGWELHRIEPGDDARVAAELASPATVVANVVSGGSASVVYTFRTNGELVQTGSGTIEIGIEVQECDCDDGNICTDDRCDPADDSCINAPVEDGTACDADGAPGVCSLGNCELRRSDIAVCGNGDCNRYDGGTGAEVGPFIQGGTVSRYRALLPNGEMWHTERLPFGAHVRLHRYLPDGSPATPVDHQYTAEIGYLAATQAGNLYMAGRTELVQGGIWKVSSDGSLVKIVDTEPSCGNYLAIFSAPPDPDNADSDRVLAMTYSSYDVFRVDLSDEDGDGVYCEGLVASLDDYLYLNAHGWIVNMRQSTDGALYVLLGDHSVQNAGLHRIKDGQITLLRANPINNRIYDFAIGPEDGLIYAILSDVSNNVRIARLDPITGTELGSLPSYNFDQGRTIDFFPQ